MINFILGAVTVTVLLGILFWLKGVRINRRHEIQREAIAMKLLRARICLRHILNTRNSNDAIRVAGQGLEESE